MVSCLGGRGGRGGRGRRARYGPTGDTTANISETRLGRWDARAVPPDQVAAVKRHVWRTKKAPRFFTWARTYRAKIAWASAAVAEQPQQHHEHVDEVEIERQRAHHCLAARPGAVLLGIEHFLDLLGVPG